MMNTIQNVIQKEIHWHKKHRGTSGKGNDFEDGFVAGLKQALDLVKKVQRIPIVADENSNKLAKTR